MINEASSNLVQTSFKRFIIGSDFLGFDFMPYFEFSFVCFKFDHKHETKENKSKFQAMAIFMVGVSGGKIKQNYLYWDAGYFHCTRTPSKNNEK